MINKYLTIINKQYPNVASEIKYFDDGHDHAVFLLSNGIAFRFSREKEHGEKDSIDNIFLQEENSMEEIFISCIYIIQ